MQVKTLFDNQASDSTLRTALQDQFPEYWSIDVATGYFALRGWAALDDLVREKAAEHEGVIARILVGMVLPGQHQAIMEALDEEISPQKDATEGLQAKAARVPEELKAHLREQLSRGIPTKEDRIILHSLRELVETKRVEIKVYTRKPLHGKTYLLHLSNPKLPSAGFVGSSNLTGPGLNSNLELNLFTTEQQSTLELTEWFEDLWNDRYTINIDADLLDIIDNSWAAPEPRSPYDVYLKTCFSMSHDVRAGLLQYEISPLIEPQLLDFQKTAVKTLARRIMQRRGTMLGDVVGLGKTITATAVALMLRDNHGFIPLVLCPKNLEKMWIDYLKKYDLPGRVVPYSMAHRILPELPRHRFVIVDESHTLRNQGTRVYDAVQRYLHDNESNVLLLTATPYNLKYADVANQLALFLDEDEDLGLTPTAALKKNEHLLNNLEVAHSTLAAFRKSEEPEDWKRLMGEHLVRRTRSFVLNNYAQTDETGHKYLEFTDGQGKVSGRFTFPNRRAIPIEHVFPETDPAKQMTDIETLDAIAELTLPRYDLTRYLTVDAERLAKGEDKAFIEDFNAARGQVSGFVRTNFYKRLSSCGYSFLLSLQRHLRRNELFIYALDNNLPLPAGTLDPATLSDDEIDLDELLNSATDGELFFSNIAADYDQLVAEDPRGIRWVTPTLFTQNLRQDLEADSQTIRDLLSRFGKWDVYQDSKLNELYKLATQTHPDEKILVFTEYKDTAKYLEHALKQLGVTNVGCATGDSEDATSLARRFSPKTNDIDGALPVNADNELRVLIATDVLSEGQNLQQAHIIANYDLPWAIIKLIQRAGRVDRIGQEADEVLLYTVVHGNLEEQLHLRQRIQQRLAQNATTFGSDEKFFGTDSETRAISDLYDGKVEDITSSDDVDASSLAYEIWENATKDNLELRRRIEALPDLIDATRPWHPGDEEGVLCYASTDSGLDSFAWENAEGQTFLLTGHEALEKLHCEPDTPALPLRVDHDEVVKTLIQDVITDNLNTSGRLRGERRITFNMVFDTLEAHQDPRFAEALDAMHKYPLTSIAITRLRRARTSKHTTTLDLLNLIADLHEEKQLTTVSTRSADAIRIVSSLGVTK